MRRFISFYLIVRSSQSEGSSFGNPLGLPNFETHSCVDLFLFIGSSKYSLHFASCLLTSAFQLVGIAFESTHAASQPLANLKDCQRDGLQPISPPAFCLLPSFTPRTSLENHCENSRQISIFLEFLCRESGKDHRLNSSNLR